jgi:hypothetical protein
MRGRWQIFIGVAVAAAIAGWLMTRSAGEPALDPDEVDRDLADLVDALRQDQRPASDLFPPAAPPVQVPAAARYRKALQFWESSTEGAPKGRS